MKWSSTSTEAKPLPLIAVVCDVPLLLEALRNVLESVAEVQRFPAGRSDTGGLLRWLQPDAIVVDSEDDAEAAVAFASEAQLPLVHISFRDDKLRVLVDGSWEELENGGVSPEAIGNIILGGIFGRGRQR
jgi:hypothetical protein